MLGIEPGYLWSAVCQASALLLCYLSCPHLIIVVYFCIWVVPEPEAKTSNRQNCPVSLNHIPVQNEPFSSAPSTDPMYTRSPKSSPLEKLREQWGQGLRGSSWLCLLWRGRSFLVLPVTGPSTTPTQSPWLPFLSLSILNISRPPRWSVFGLSFLAESCSGFVPVP